MQESPRDVPRLDTLQRRRSDRGGSEIVPHLKSSRQGYVKNLIRCHLCPYFLILISLIPIFSVAPTFIPDWYPDCFNLGSPWSCGSDDLPC